jgi:hypothetical protein
VSAPAFTKGPWHVVTGGYIFRDQSDGRGALIARMSNAAETGAEEHQANTDLIVAAPELYSALAQVRDMAHQEAADAIDRGDPRSATQYARALLELRDVALGALEVMSEQTT